MLSPTAFIPSSPTRSGPNPARGPSELRVPPLRRAAGAPALALLLLLGGWPGGAAPAVAQPAAFPGEPTASATDLALLLRGMGDDRRVLMVAAHPDDEDTALLAHLALGQGARTAYLSLTRGEGGQNLIGPELDEGLGLVRTGELLAARQLDGATQYFSRAFDFGYSRTAEETFSHWPREEVLEDVVRTIRTLRPQVLISVFHGTARDGHGHHMASGMLAVEAFEAAADPARFSHLEAEGLLPWAPTKLYRLLWREPPTRELRVETGVLDPLLGRSHFQVAMASRSRHRSQDMGVAESPGPRASRLELVASRGFGTDDPEAPLFAGIATGLLAMAELAGGGMEISRRLQNYEAGLTQVRASLHPERPEVLLPALASLLTELLEAREAAEQSLEHAWELQARVGWGEVVDALRFRERRLGEALLLAAGVVVEARVDRALLVPGEEARVEVLAWNAGGDAVKVEGVELLLPAGWADPRTDTGPREEAPPSPVGVGAAPVPLLLEEGVGGGDGHEGAGGGPPAARGVTLPAQALGEARFVLGVPAGAEPSQPHFLRAPRDGSLYRWPEGDPARGKGADPGPIHARVQLVVAGVPVEVQREGTHVSVDKALGQERTPVHVAPRLSVALERSSMAWPAHDQAERAVRVRVWNPGVDGVEGRVVLEGPEGWEVRPASQPLALERETETEFVFVISPVSGQLPPEAGATTARFHARVLEARPRGQAPAREGEAALDHTFTRIDYPHLDPLPLLTPAELQVHRFPVRVREGIQVGYVMGPGDAGVEALLDLGVEVRLLDEEALLAGDLTGLDVVVLGARAYETRMDLARATPRLLAWAREGGTLVAQYNKYEFPDGGFAPYPVAMRRPHDRVTDPDAQVVFPNPEHPLLQGPNRLSEEDFQGWVQERGLYFLSEWSPPFVPLVEMADPGLDPVQGGWVVAPLGRGAYVYTGLALFRQWPRGVPGAFRILANLVSLQGEALEENPDLPSG